MPSIAQNQNDEEEIVLRKLPDFGDDLFDDPGPALPPEGMEMPEFPDEHDLTPIVLRDPEFIEDFTTMEGALPRAAGAPQWTTELHPSLMDAIELRDAGFASGIADFDYVRVMPDGSEVPYNPNAHQALPLPLAPADSTSAPPAQPTAPSDSTAAATASVSAPTSIGTVATPDPVAIEAILNAAELEVVNQNTLVHEFGAFMDLEKRMRGITDGVLSGTAEQLVTSYIRRAMHGAQTSDPKLAKPEFTQEGNSARVKALVAVAGALGSPELGLKRMLDQLQDAGVMGASSLFHDLKMAVDTERKDYADKADSMAPPSLGRMLFNSLRAGADSMTNQHVVGNARQHRNGELTKSLRSLYEVGAELKANAGNAAWEADQGKASLKEAKALSKRIEGLTKGVEDQVDGLALRKGFNDVNNLLKEAGASAADAEHKKALEAMNEFINNLVKKITEALGALFNRNAGSRRSSPTAL